MTTLNCDKWDTEGRQTSEDVADRSSRTDTASRYWLPMTATDSPLADMQWQYVAVLRSERRFFPPYFEKLHKTTKTSAVFPKPFATKNKQTNKHQQQNNINNNNNQTTNQTTTTRQSKTKNPTKTYKKYKNAHKTNKISKIKKDEEREREREREKKKKKGKRKGKKDTNLRFFCLRQPNGEIRKQL